MPEKKVGSLFGTGIIFVVIVTVVFLFTTGCGKSEEALRKDKIKMASSSELLEMATRKAEADFRKRYNSWKEEPLMESKAVQAKFRMGNQYYVKMRFEYKPKEGKPNSIWVLYNVWWDKDGNWHSAEMDIKPDKLDINWETGERLK